MFYPMILLLLVTRCQKFPGRRVTSGPLMRIPASEVQGDTGFLKSNELVKVHVSMRVEECLDHKI